MRRWARVMAAAALLTPVAAARGEQGRPTAPTLVVVVTVDQMRGDYLDRWASQYTGAFARIRREGAVFLNAAQDHAIPETAAGHATIGSGRHPASTGILRNGEGVRDSMMPLLEVADSGASPARFRGTTLIDWMRSRWPGARAFSVSRKDRSAILPVGRTHDAVVLWYAQGQFTTSRWYADTLPAWVRAFNRAAVVARAPGRVWELLLDSSQYPEPDSMPYENNRRDIVFPHRMPADSAGAARAFIDYPWMDSLTLAMALRGVEELHLGARGGPDFLHVGLSATDRVGHGWGPDSRELHDQVLRVDRWLGVFLDSLTALRGAGRVVVVLTADHGVASFPEWRQAHGDTVAGYINVDTVLDRYRAAVRARVMDPGFAPFGYREYGLVTLNRAALAGRGVDADSLADALRADLARMPGVLRVDTWRTIAHADTARDRIARRWIHMLPPELDAVVLITPREHVVFGPGRGNARHGQLSDEGSSVTLAFWGRPFRHRRIARRASTVDIAPTLARVLGVAADAAVQGRVLTEALVHGR